MTKKLKELGLSERLIKRITKRLNRMNWFLSRDIKDITIDENYIYFWSNHWDEEIVGIPYTK